MAGIIADPCKCGIKPPDFITMELFIKSVLLRLFPKCRPKNTPGKLDS